MAEVVDDVEQAVGVDGQEIPAVNNEDDALIDLFSLNEHLENLTNRDPLVEVVGYVDEVHNPRSVAQDRYRLFKFILNNGHGRRIQVLIWGDLIEQHQPSIQLRNVIHLEGVLSKTCNLTYVQQQQNLVPFELNLQNQSRINVLGTYEEESILNGAPAAANEVDFNTLSNFHSHHVAISGFIKIEFRIIISPLRGSRSLVGLITDGEKKLQVTISSYTDEGAAALQRIPKKCSVKVVGKSSYDANRVVMITCPNTLSVLCNAQIPSMPTSQVLRGNRNVVANLRAGIQPQGTPPL